MIGFRFHRGMGLDYKRQGYIYFVCRNFERLSRRDQDAISACAEEYCGGYAAAVMRLVTSGDSYQRVAIDHYMSVNTLYRAVTAFYRHFPL